MPAEVAPELEGNEQAVALWEFRDEDGRRVGLRVLIAPADAWIGVPTGVREAYAWAGEGGSSSRSSSSTLTG